MADMTEFLSGFTPFKADDVEKYTRLGWWAGLTFGDILDRAAETYPDKEALVDGNNRLTFSQVRDKVNRLAVGLMGLEIAVQERVLVQLPNWNEFVFAYFALQKIGAIPVLLIDRYRQHEISHFFKLTGATSWILPEKYQRIDYRPVIDAVLQDHPQTKNIILVRGTQTKKYLNLEKLIENAVLAKTNLFKLKDQKPDSMQVAHMGPTGGTTGLPKVAPRTHNDYLCNVKYAAKAWKLDSGDTCLLAGPVGHDLTFSKGLCAGILTGGKSVFLDSTEPKNICETIERERITAVVWVPTLARRLINFDRLKDYDLSSLKKMHCGGGVSSPDLIEAVMEKIGCKFFNAYGSTEGQSTMTRSNDDLETVYHTVGKPTCPHDIYRVVDGNGKELPSNTQGELLVKGPGVFSGYYKAPLENKDVFAKNGFFKTGDIAKIDDSGCITLTGRMKEMINRGGESISAVEIENLIILHPDVEAVAAIGMPDPEMGERVCAYIQAKPGITLGFEKIISFIREQGASVLQLPERIEFIDSMPLTETKKLIDKKALQKDIKKKIEPL